MKENQYKKVALAITEGVNAYDEVVRNMSDAELWAHCFEDGDIRRDDFCFQEWKRRETKELTDTIKSLVGFCDLRFGNIDEPYNEIRKKAVKVIENHETT